MFFLNEIDLSNFKTNEAFDMKCMFSDSTSLNNLDITN